MVFILSGKIKITSALFTSIKIIKLWHDNRATLSTYFKYPEVDRSPSGPGADSFPVRNLF